MAKELTQKRFPVQLDFRFEDETLHYAYADTSGGHAFSVAYEDVATDPAVHGHVTVKLDWYQHMAVVMAALALVQVFFGFLPNGLMSAVTLAAAAGLLYGIYRLSTRDYTVMRSDVGTIFVLKDDHQHEILEELDARRKARLRLRFAEIDFSNDLTIELQKFGWLLQQGVISKEEYEAAKYQLLFAHAGWALAEPKQLN
jgi:hypothetical protein